MEVALCRYRNTEIVAPPNQGSPVGSFVEDRSSGPRRLDGPLLRPEQAAELLAVKPSWVYDAVRTGRLPCLRVGRHIRFTQTMLENWLTDQ
jgi:excisionase family DNA binding protein